MLVNGVEVINYKSEDKVYYGPLESVRVFNGGTNFDVVNLTISNYRIRINHCISSTCSKR